MKHSILPPSNAARRVACPGSWKLEQTYPQREESSYEKEGDAAHWVASEMLKNKDVNYINTSMTAPNGERVTEGMLEGAELYFDTISSMQSLDSLNNLHIEEKVDISIIHPDCWGTPDCWYFDSYKNELIIWDYKFGFNLVEVFENWQLIEYSAGILKLLPYYDFTKVTFCIVQPRAYHPQGRVRTWVTTVKNLVHYFLKLQEKEEDALSPDAKCDPSPECTYCTARFACNALRNHSLRSIDLSKNNSAIDLTPEQLGDELRYLQYAADLLNARISGMQEEAIWLLKQGKKIPAFKLEESRGRDRWTKSPEEIIALGQLFGQDLSKPIEPITPKQALKTGIPEDIIKSYSESQKGSMKLVRNTLEESRKIFGNSK